MGFWLVGGGGIILPCMCYLQTLLHYVVPFVSSIDLFSMKGSVPSRMLVLALLVN